MRTTKLSTAVLRILSTAKVEGKTVKLTCGQVDRKLYDEVNFALEALGGKWDRKAKGHVFSENPSDVLDIAILTGEVTKQPKVKNGYFPTPLPVIEAMLQLANLCDGMSVLEPSAGQGAIAQVLRERGFEPTCCEILEENRRVLHDKCFFVISDDFFQYSHHDYDRIIMNPPFEKQADIDHVLHAFELLRTKGRLVSVMSAGVTFRDDKKAITFRKFLEENNGEIVPLPAESFKESGTCVNAVLVTVARSD